MPTFNSETGVLVVKNAIDILASINVTSWIQDGTLLGAVREGKIIDWDFDLDIGAYSWEWSEKATNILLENGYYLKNSFNTLEDRLHLKFLKDDVQFDVFLYYNYDNEHVFHGITQEHFLCNGKKYIFIYKKDFLIKNINLLGHELPAPFPPEDFLIQKYGDSWRIPNSDWNPFTSPVNSVIID
jgi:phosphorylcholine metabolism protein LicD